MSIYERIRGLSPRIEVLIVAAAVFGPFIAESFAALLAPAALTISNADLISLIVEQIVLFAMAGWFLHVRGWTLPRAGLSTLHWSDIGIGLVLGVVMSFVIALTIEVLSVPFPRLSEDADPANIAAGGLSPVLVMAVSMINPLFEESTVCGYLIAALKKEGDIWTAVNISVAIRLLYHLYQGPVSVALVPFGLICAFWFARTGRLWPIVIAHAIFDIAGLAPYAGG